MTLARCLVLRSHSWPSRQMARKAYMLLTSRSMSTAAQDEMMRLLRDQYRNEIEALPEHRASILLADFLEAKAKQRSLERTIVPPIPPPEGYRHEMNAAQIRLALDAAMATFCLHVESRVAALVGKGFYTIGPCGEETLSSVAHVLKQEDSAALHYRHSGINLARQLLKGQSSLEQLLLDRARGYTVSRLDPVTGGVHCSIGSEHVQGELGGDFIVTSTLASQCPSAVGRALGYSLSEQYTGYRPVSLVTVGDGSVHNHHFWSAFHLARHARHRRIKCPAVFGISDNGLSISYSTGGYVDTLFDNDSLVPLYRVNGNDMMDVYSKTMSATEYSRMQSAPSVVLFRGITRRFGHAATDRQSAYLEEKRIQSMADIDVLESSIAQAVETFSASTYPELHDRFLHIQDAARSAFATAAEEDKVDRNDMLERLAPPLHIVPSLPPELTIVSLEDAQSGRREVMRKHMTRVIEEVMREDDSVVYIGEDVRHGGYYVVTDGLAEKFPNRVNDFPAVSQHSFESCIS